MDPVLRPPSDERCRSTRGVKPDTAGPSGQQRHERDADGGDPGLREQAGRLRWAALLQRVFDVDTLRCLRCGSNMRLLAAIEDPEVAQRILECLEFPARAPPLGKAAGLHDEPVRLEDDRFFDQSAGHEEA